tara:strand:+ start:50086 stop:52659 length:2574 start_codon:yes stop_codon:yes gene_type:complete
MKNKFSHIQIRGAKTHNLKNIDIDIALGKLTCLQGPSGSGKTSLAFHTLFQESKRRLINSFPSDIKFFWDIPQTANVDRIEPVLPVWALAQHNPVVGARPSLGDLMGLTERLQQVFYFLGQNHCPEHMIEFKQSKKWHQVLPKRLDPSTTLHIFISSADYNHHIKSGVLPVRSLGDDKVGEFVYEHLWWEIARVKASSFEEQIELKLRELELHHFHGVLKIVSKDGTLNLEVRPGEERVCGVCAKAEPQEITHFNHLSPYNGIGACHECDGHGMILKYDPNKLVKEPKLSVRDGAVSVMNYKSFQPWRNDMFKAFKRQGMSLETAFKELPQQKWKLLYDGDGAYPGFNDFFEYLESKRYKTHVRILIRSLKSEFLCPSCHGTRLSRSLDGFGIKTSKESFLWKDFIGKNINQFGEDLARLINQSQKLLHYSKVEKILSDISETIETARSLGIGNLSLADKVKQLTAGQYQRVLLTKLLSFRGSGSLFVFDEPTLGLDQNEVSKLLVSLKKLRDQGNTILVVEHSEQVISACDEVVEMGPGAGADGGNIIYQGKPKHSRMSLKKFETKKDFDGYLKVIGAPGPNDWCFDYEIPVRAITVVTGPSEGGKRQAVVELLEQWGVDESSISCVVESPLKFDKIISFGAEASRVTARSTVGTFLGLANYLRKHFSELPVSRAMNLKEGHFSYNSELGKCPTCEGRGTTHVDMSFLEDVLLTCDDCKGMKLRPYYAQIRDGYQSYHEALNKPVRDSFAHIPTTAKAKRILQAMDVLRLGHLSLDRSLQSLSGGERQRIKLLGQVQGRMGPSLLLFENVSFGLSELDLEALYAHLQRLRQQGHTLVLIDQHPNLREYADYALEIQ